MEPDRPKQHFPDTYSIKAIGKDEAGFAEFVIELVRSIVGDGKKITHQTRASRNGAYLSVTVSFVASDQAQLDRVFSEMGASDRTVYVL